MQNSFMEIELILLPPHQMLVHRFHQLIIVVSFAVRIVARALALPASGKEVWKPLCRT